MTSPEILLQGSSSKSILSALDDIDEQLTRLRVGVSYVTQGGMHALYDRLRDNDLLTSETKEQWVLGVDQAITQPAAIRELFNSLNDNQSGVRVFSEDGVFTEASDQTPFLHSKLMWFETETTTHVILGSMNLTSKAITENWEANIILRDLEEDATLTSLNEWWTAAWEEGLEVTEARINRYEEYRRDTIEADRPSYLKATGHRSIKHAEFLYADIGPTMGAADHQFEVSKAALKFFWGADAPEEVQSKDSVKVSFVIRDPLQNAGAMVQLEQKNFENRSVRAHPNEMTRINLPTDLGREIDLEGRKIIFERLGDRRFGVTIVPSEEEDELFQPLRNRARELGQFESMRGGREYGWF